MKTATVPSMVKIEADLSEFKPVDETLATHLPFSEPIMKTRTFGTIDLWNCRRQQRYSSLRIR